MKSRPSRFACPQVRKRIVLLVSGVWLLRVRISGGFGDSTIVAMVGTLQQRRLRSPQLVHVVREASIADLYPALVQPSAHILQRVSSFQQIPNLRPCLAHLASLRARFFRASARRRGRSSSSEGGLATAIIIREISAVHRKYPKGFRTFLKVSVVGRDTGMFQKISRHFGKFQFLRRNIMRKGSTDLVVEHKGCAGARVIFLRLRAFY